MHLFKYKKLLIVLLEWYSSINIDFAIIFRVDISSSVFILVYCRYTLIFISFYFLYINVSKF